VTSPDQVGHPLQRHEGQAVLTAHEAAIKGVLESEAAVSRFIFTQSSGSRSLERAVLQPSIKDFLRRHRLVVRSTDDAGRVMQLGRWAARDGRHVVVVLSGPTVGNGIRALLRSVDPPLEEAEGLAVLLEDDAGRAGLRAQLVEAGLPVLEATSVSHVRDAVEHTLRLSRGARIPAVMLVDRDILRAMSSVKIHPNRMGGSPLAGPPRRRGPRWDQLGGPLRITRRLELNSARSMPSPGERAPVGFIVVGAVVRAMRRIEVILGVEGRVPTLHLVVSNPLDEAAIERLLLRCRDVVVLEPSGQTVEVAARRRAQRLAGDGQTPASVWGRELPGGASAAGLTHPSPLARVLTPLIQPVVTGTPLEERLSSPPPPCPAYPDAMKFGEAAHAAHIRASVLTTLEAGGEPDEAGEEPPEDGQQEPIQWLFDGLRIGPAEGRVVMCEVWTASSFRRNGAAAVRQAAVDGGSWLMVVAASSGSGGQDLERLTRAVTPSAAANLVRVQRPTSPGPAELARHMRGAAAAAGLTVLILEDGPPPRFDAATFDREVEDVDRVGYQVTQQLVWPADRACVIRQPSRLRQRDQWAVHEAVSSRATMAVEAVPLRWPPRVAARVQPIVEQIEVRRSRAPSRGVGDEAVPGQPEFLHAESPVWYAHLAGLRSTAPGVVAAVLQEAAVVMGYHVETLADPMPIGPGRRAHAQIVFSRPRDQAERAAVPPIVPWGEADLLIGYDRLATLRAVDPDGALRVAGRGRTRVVANTGAFEEEIDRGDEPEGFGQIIAGHLERALGDDAVTAADVTGACRFQFHNERLADMVLLGMAWQSGAIPLSLDAMHQAMQRVKASGVARLAEAFEHGRAAWGDPDGLLRTQEAPLEPAGKSVRRYRLMLARGKGYGRDRADRFRQLVERAIGEVPGLLETSPGREAHRDFIVALRRCVTWGGFELAERFADRIIALYRADRADTGRALTRAAVLPLAESLLIRDAVYVASMAIGSEHRRLTRQRLNVRKGRGDHISVRYLTRIECTFVRWRLRLDLRSSDWLAHVLAALRWVVPSKLRGRRSQRQVRDLVKEAVMQAASAPEDHYDGWHAAIEWMHEISLDGRLRRISPAAFRREIRRRREADQPSS
jgi:Pyruvate/2-oxoacid:ferredoxin oxidoreductase gamma subunit